MVKAPVCKVCGSAHFGAIHVWSGTSKIEASREVGNAAAVDRGIAVKAKDAVASAKSRQASVEREVAPDRAKPSQAEGGSYRGVNIETMNEAQLRAALREIRARNALAQARHRAKHSKP
jgi:hypothetical protein